MSYGKPVLRLFEILTSIIVVLTILAMSAIGYIVIRYGEEDMNQLIVIYDNASQETYDCDTITECRSMLKSLENVKRWIILGQDGSVVDESDQ